MSQVALGAGECGFNGATKTTGQLHTEPDLDPPAPDSSRVKVASESNHQS
jgi:hypothetical protein